MAGALIPCSSCQRHMRASESACPFCGCAHSAEEIPTATVPRVTRAVMFTLGAIGTSLALSSCLPVAAYGAPSPPPDVSTQDGGNDAGASNDVPDADTGGPAVRYGAPPPPDDWC